MLFVNKSRVLSIGIFHWVCIKWSDVEKISVMCKKRIAVDVSYMTIEGNGSWVEFIEFERSTERALKYLKQERGVDVDFVRDALGSVEPGEVVHIDIA